MFKKTTVLDHGSITLVDYMGGDKAVTSAARHSYDKSDKNDDDSSNLKLINYLMKHKHTSPFEQPTLVFEVKAPLFVFAQWHRHRTARLNVMSARYSVLPDEYYIPEFGRVKAQSKLNKQGSDGQLDPGIVNDYLEDLRWYSAKGMELYYKYTNLDIAKEITRFFAPTNTYSKMVWQLDLSNILKFLKLRDDPHAQAEIRKYASVISEVVAKSFPMVFEAWYEYEAKALSLSRTDRDKLSNLLLMIGWGNDNNAEVSDEHKGELEKWINIL